MIAFVCASYIQTIRAFQIHSEMDEFREEADLFLVNKMFQDPQLLNRFRETHFFKNVYYIDTSVEKSMATLKYMYGKKYKDIFRKYSYKKVISFNIEEIIAQVLYNLNEEQTEFEFHCMEDCPSVYNVYLPPKFGWKHPYRWLRIKKPFYNIKTWWTSCPELMTFPEVCQFEVRKLPAIDVNNKKLLETINFVYDYKPDEVLDRTDCLIMEESHYTDGLMIDNQDYKMYKKIVERYPDVQFAIKLHPRTKENRFKDIIPNIQNSQMPWELITWNRIASNENELFQLSIVCGTMVSDKLLFGYEGTKMLLAKIFKGFIRTEGEYCRISNELIQNYEKFQKEFKSPKQFALPRTEEEMFEVLDEKWINKEGIH